MWDGKLGSALEEEKKEKKKKKGEMQLCLSVCLAAAADKFLFQGSSVAVTLVVYRLELSTLPESRG